MKLHNNINKIILMLFAMILLTGFVSALTSITDCTTISVSDETYSIDNNIIGTGGTCIMFNEDLTNILIEGNNFNITTPATSLSFDVENDLNVTIQNVNLYGVNGTSPTYVDWAYGINLAGVRNVTLNNLTFTDVFNPITIYPYVNNVENLLIENMRTYNSANPILYLETGMPVNVSFRNIFINYVNITDYSSYSSILYYVQYNSDELQIGFENITFENINGKVHFNNLDWYNGTYEIAFGTSFGTSTFFQYPNLVYSDSSMNPVYNSSATITLYNLPSTTGVILRDGLPCDVSICSNLVYSDGNSTATFDVTSWSSYSLEESPIIVQTQTTPSEQISPILRASGYGIGALFGGMTNGIAGFLLMLIPIILIIAVVVGASFMIRGLFKDA